MHVNISPVTVSDCYDCVTMVGAIMAGAASETCFPELIRVVKSGTDVFVGNEFQLKRKK